MGLYTPLIAVGLMLAAFCLRRFTTPWGWVHTAAGAFAVAAVTGMLEAIAEAIRTGGLHAASIVPAVVTFIGSLMAMANPSTRKDEEPPKKLGMLLPLLLLPALLSSGCGTASGKALKTCELNALPAAMQSVEAEVLALAMDLSTWASDLVTLAIRLGKDQVACAAQALAAFFDKTPAPETLANSVRAFASGPPTDSDARAHAKKVLHDYLTLPGTPTSCRPVKVAEIEEGGFRPVVVDDDVPEAPATLSLETSMPLWLDTQPAVWRVSASGIEVMRLDPSGVVYVYGLRVL